MDRVQFCPECSKLILDSFRYCPWCGAQVKPPCLSVDNWEAAFFPLRLYLLRQKIDALDEELAGLCTGGWEL